MIFVLLALALLDISSAQIIQLGQCDPNIQLEGNFNFNEFNGTWYVVSRTNTGLINGDCSYFQFTDQNDVTSSVYKRSVKNNFLEEISGTASLQSGTAKLSLSTTASTQPTDFWIMLTDPEHYALAYACEDLGTTHRIVTIWQLGRRTTLEFPLMTVLMDNTLINRLNISLSDLITLDHSELACAELPMISEGQPIILPGQCNQNTPVVQNFDVERFTGVWHEIASYYSPHALGTCPRAQYTLAGNVVNVVNSQVVDQSLDTISGTATVSSTDNSARLTVRLEVQPGIFAESPLWILATDYTDYAVSYVCVDIENNRRQITSWILSRTRRLSSAGETNVNQIINSNLDLNSQYFIQANQSDDGCFYFPEAVPNQPVTFRGQCDMNIPAMPNFDVERYLGIWHDIESYPSEFQGGTCNNAEYTLGDGLVDVFNTQVIDQGLDTIRGVARLASTDGSAKLVVTFPIAGTDLTVDTDYWVLRTDYTSYALVYTCLNLNEDERRVWSWKISRTKQLPTNAVVEINEIISTIPVLNQTYYENRDQSVEGCFYFPEPQPNLPVVFPGQCDDSVPVVQGFNMEQFAGFWYEIQAYPKNEQTGQCIQHTYAMGPENMLNLQTSSVADQQLLVSSSNVSFSSTDGSAKLLITINNGTQVIRIPFWILSTDYTNYALAYSCVDIDQDFRAIYSWKLSRTQQLSAAANTQINNAISNNVVLDNRYFEDIDHSDRACFALPDIPAGEPFIVNGQCDRNIQGVPNFDAARYLGRWRLIESYASDFQTGTCNDATYSSSADGVIVVNTQVVNQNLDTILGSAVVNSTDNSGILAVTFPGAEPIEYVILDTDYDTYSLVYSCSDIDGQRRRVWSWKMSRTRDLSPTAIDNMNRVIDNIDVLNNRYYEIMDQSDTGCFYYPTPEPNTPVIFRGRCDPNINVVTNFNAVSYMGKWYDIASYPSLFQDGTCNTAQYTLVGDTVDVYNTQVINQTLDTINGVARVNSTDGSAKLIVSFPIADTQLTVETDYWVLATDYNSYALVYTCLEIDDETKQVWSWKLSRTTQLTAAATTAINQAISTVPVLDDRYYNQKDHSDEGCFYFPEPEIGVPVVFPGLCDSTIQAIPNFNMASFAGVWYEIDAYPKEFQPGQCVNHEYTTGTGNTLNLVSSNVNNLTLNTTTSTLRFSTAQDTSGKLEIVTVSNNIETVIPFWIIDTDYSRYALAYSCVNIDDRSRAVYSWKLSRTMELSGIDDAFINTAMNAIPVLDNRYFEQIDQSADACFYLPEYVPGQTVVFPGSCDQNISVVQNFDPTRYVGRWRMIESYPSEFQSGGCNDATYSLTPGGTVDVYNTQVINQNLDTINGSAVLATTDGSGKLLVTFPGAPEPSEYWILATDYDTYALVYSCRNINDEQRGVWSWKLSRTAELTSQATTNIDQVVNTIDVLNDRYYENIDQSDNACFYYPTPDGNPVIFRGQCNESISVVTNFDAVAYMGKWYDIASYPSLFQDGTCNTAQYTLVGDTVDVYNTQVINQTLDTINGVARVNSTDGSAKLIVTFPIAGTPLTVETNYWVLATDYSSYALVYTCLDIDLEYRQVWSWKLSRTTQLTAAATTAINQVISTVPVLDDRYYNQKDHSDEGCFYFPEPEIGVPVVFPGLCDSSIQAIPNFNMASFTGVWYEIDAYPKEFQPGQCVNHEYTTGTGNTLNLVSSNVNNLTLNTTTSTLRFSTAQDTSGKLEIVTVSNNIETVIPFWIIDTDYSRYALAYSCVNIDDRSRAVYSWKLSRTRELSGIDDAFINTAMNAIPVLENRYFEQIDQSADACFYLPEYIPGQTVVFPGSCDQNISVVQNFDPTRYVGRWRMIESYPSEFQSGGCNDATYSLTPGGTVDVYNTQVINQNLDTINGSAVLATTDGSGKLLVTFPGAPEPSEYWILATDYDTYALVYSCRNINDEQRGVWSWKLSRTAELTSEASAAINQVVNTIDVLNDRYYENIDQSDDACFYYPTPDGNPVIFRGQCNESISVVTNFDAVAYMGKWYDIASYPSLFQDGTCNTAQYTLVGDTVDVYNTQVINQTLDTINGVARVNSTDGSAKLIVTFPIAGTPLTVETNYWVLATDYSSYALVYTCLDIDLEYRQVWSWKLSRTTQLTAAATTAINQAISTVPVLDDRYYNQKDHSDEGCFYFPEPEIGVPVVFPGLCDSSIQAIPNFNMASFAGVWNEIEAYPKEFQPGQCVNHEYTTGTGNTLNLVSSNINNLTLNTTTSTLRFSTAQDTSGKLEIVTVSNNIETVIPFWIIDTDYSRYALAYSCVNIDDRSRAVYSWKLSRTKELSANENTSINNAMNAVPVLDNRYFEQIDQSDDACFYLPDYVPGQNVVFPGSCDQNISVVQNFDPTRYVGRWRMIESYPSEFQSGGCNDATYSLTPGGTVDVYNTQVINQNLDTINGSAVLATTDGSGKLLVTFPGAPEPSEYWILATDYDTYALVYSCRNINDEQRGVWSWKLSRTAELTSQASTDIDQVINTIDVLNDRYYENIDQSEEACFYYPTPDGNPVTFRGRCNESISVVTNFDAVAYMGKWYDLESYPVQFQDGTCPTASYTLTDDGVLVYNTQVRDEELDTINGVAVLASNDGSAKLTVSFPIAGTDFTTEAPYWVLATDYHNYALVYSCSNIGDEYYRVSSWKLSRQWNLTQASHTAIDNAIAQVPVLRQDYYLQRGHDDASCFYYPDNEGGPVLLDGFCDNNDIDIVSDFNINSFSGTWYEAERFPSELQAGDCVANKYQPTGANSFHLTKTIVYNERTTVVSGPAIVAADNRGIIDVNLSDGAGSTFATTLYVIDVEYNDFALLYGCRDVDNERKQIYSWKLSRYQEGLSEAANTRIDATVNKTVDLFRGYYDETDQTLTGCFYYPEYDGETPIDLIGGCDESIRGKPNFDVNRYLGKWYETASYPQAFQEGECARALYSPGNGVVDVMNTQVVNRTLDVMAATAVVASTDGSGLLSVTFVLGGGVVNTVNYYILETDYDSFALVYSCRNTDDGRRLVTSWKLSRDTTLSNQAEAIIAPIIDATQGLLEDYYQPTSQTEDDCFYIPEVNKNEAPRFRGRCETISGVQGFDAQRYVGWWHEIERYPVDASVGECISSTFSAAGNQYQVVDTNIFDLVAETNTSTVSVTNDGRLRKTYSNGQVEDIWVLATDYETYSLLYSCENIDSQYMRVWSAKHSKSRTLTPAAQEAMEPAITGNRVLEPQFYQAVDQSDDACFHYPEQAGQQIILPGQCDDNIPVQQEFDPAHYTGTWYQTERYPQIHESGSCVGARYTLDENTGIVTVVNWQVIEDTLDTIEGTATVNSTDGSAKLWVNLPIRGTDDENPGMVSMWLYVLETNYLSYSVTYSCVNVDNFNKAVGVWKLSRTRTMLAADETAINSLISRRPELHQPYFLTVEQNEDCDEPNSATTIYHSIIISLVCIIVHAIK